jgi:hypothetical protein
MKHRRPPVEKETLDHIQRGRAQFLEYAESETLSDRRVDAIENCVCSCAFKSTRRRCRGIDAVVPPRTERTRALPRAPSVLRVRGQKTACLVMVSVSGVSSNASRSLRKRISRFTLE